MEHEQLPPFFYEIFDASVPRLGPGDNEATVRVLKRLLALRAPDSREPRIIDVGCGSGAQTIQLARHSTGTILAVDNHEEYLQELQRRAAAEGLSGRIETCLRDMHRLGPDVGTFDIVWSESALFVMGFREGLVACHDLLVPGGFLAASEMCWFRPDAPSAIRKYFDEVYPAIATLDAHLAVIQDCGYEVLEHFNLPESAWWDEYYLPIQARLNMLRAPWAGDPERTGLLDAIQTEIDMYRRFSGYYGYVLFLLRRP